MKPTSKRQFYLYIALSLVGCQGQKLDSVTVQAIKEIEASVIPKKAPPPAEESVSSREYAEDTAPSCEQNRGELKKINEEIRGDLEWSNLIINSLEWKLQIAQSALDRVLIGKTANEAFAALNPEGGKSET